MAYGFKNISPLDLKPSTAIGVALPFDGENVFTSVYTTKEQIKYNIMNFLLTNPGERVFNPTFGAGIRSSLFEQITSDSLDQIEMSIRAQVEANFPQIRVVSLNVIGDPDYNSVNVKFSYRLLQSNETDAVTLTIQSA
jgi:phage baseplate assembly protein W